MPIDSEPQAANNKSQCKKSVTAGIHNNNNNCVQFPNKESTGSMGEFFFLSYFIEQRTIFI